MLKNMMQLLDNIKLKRSYRLYYPFCVKIMPVYRNIYFFNFYKNDQHQFSAIQKNKREYRKKI